MTISHPRQSGATLLILMLVVMTVFATLLVASLRGRNPEETRRDQSAVAIEQARQALIAWSLSRDGTADGTSSGRALSPVELPCPADPNAVGDLEGVSVGFSCAGTASTWRMGLFPWKTMGIPKITDAYGEPLWYSVDQQFAVRFQANTVRRVNSDSFSSLQVFSADGTTNYSLNGETAAAVIFAAGPPVAGQNRSGTLTASQYLDSDKSIDNFNVDVSAGGGKFIAGKLTATFNDQLGIITGRELIDRAAMRLGSVIRLQIYSYYDAYAKSPVGIAGGVPTAAPLSVGVGLIGMTGTRLVAAPASALSSQNVLVWVQKIVGLAAPAANAAQSELCTPAWQPSVKYTANEIVSDPDSNGNGNLKNYTAKDSGTTKGVRPRDDPAHWLEGNKCSGSSSATSTPTVVPSPTITPTLTPTPTPTTSSPGACQFTWTTNGHSGTLYPLGTAYRTNDFVIFAGKSYQAKNQIGIGSGNPASASWEWTDKGDCTVTVPILAPYPYPADMLNDPTCRDNAPLSTCASKLNLCAGILPRSANSWTGVGVLPSPISGLPIWFEQNIWHRGIFYAVKQGAVCKTVDGSMDFQIDGMVDSSIDALFILPGSVIRPTPNPAARANNLVAAASASPDLALYLEDSANQNKWLNPNDRVYVTPSCTSNDVMYTCSKGVCSKRKRAC